MDNIINALLEQRLRLVQEVCDINHNESSAEQKIDSLNEQIERIDAHVIKIIEHFHK